MRFDSTDDEGPVTKATSLDARVELPSPVNERERLFEASRYIPQSAQCMLWGKAAGRCEFLGCNKPLWKSSVTQEQVNIGQKAHIYAFSTAGPRGNDGIAKRDLNNIGNLILVCHECHRKLDREGNTNRYSATLVRAMKKEHERRIELATSISPEKRSHVLLYGCNIGEHGSPVNYAEATQALFPCRYPTSDNPLELNTVNSSFLDRHREFWAIEGKNLVRKFDHRVRERIASGEVKHLSVFALAPQPLLILLGALLGDIIPADVYQRHREPPSWEWPAHSVDVQPFKVARSGAASGTPALVLSLSGTIQPERIRSVLGTNVSLWTISLQHPHNDFTKSREQLSSFRSLLRKLLDEIKAVHGETATLHVFPAASVSAAIELGRVRMPKADLPWQVYDQNGTNGFVTALSIPYGG